MTSDLILPRCLSHALLITILSYVGNKRKRSQGPRNAPLQTHSGHLVLLTLTTRGLKKSLVDLNSISNATTRRLDDTYYAVLEKLSTLQGTIIAMKELALMSQETTRTFESESEELVGDMKSQLDVMGQFETQQERIDSLQSRIYAGRHRVQELSERVDVVRERIEGWENADRAWQGKTRKRLKAIWIIMSILILIMILILLSGQLAPAAMDISVLPETNTSISLGPISKGPTNQKLASSSPDAGSRKDGQVGTHRGTGRDFVLTDSDEVLRLFDEL